MTDYGCPPLWWDLQSEGIGPIEPASLGISVELQKDLWQWADQFEAILNWDDPGNSAGFSSETADREFEETGRALSRRLAEELGAKAKVRFWKD